MNIIILFDRACKRIQNQYRTYLFRKKCFIKHHDIKLVGAVTLINTNLKIGRGVVIYPDVVFWGDGEITIGNHVNIGPGTVFYASKEGGIKIGDYTNIAAQSYIIDMDHGMKAGTLVYRQMNSVKPVSIGKDVWIAAGAKVLKGTTIEDGAVIGAGAVAKGYYHKNSISVGVPAKVIKYKE